MQKPLRIDKIIGNTLLSVQWRTYLGTIQDIVTSQIALQKTNIFLWIPVIFACGIGTYFSLPFEPPLALLLFLLALIIATYNIVSKFKLILLVLLIYIAGFGAATYRTHSIAAPIISKKIHTAQITGQIQQIEKLDKGQGSRIVLSVFKIKDLDASKTPDKVRLTIRKDGNISIGQRVRLLAGLTPPSEALIPDGFNFRRYLYFQKIGAVGFVYNEPKVLSTKQSNANLSFIAPYKRLIESLRRQIEIRIYKLLPPNHASIASALLVGKKNAIDNSDKQAMRDGGLAHMLAISGLHVGIFAGTLFFIVRFLMACIPSLALRYQIKKISAVIAVIGAIFYMLIAGSTIPTQRAVLMISIVFLAIILDRSPISLRLVAISAFIVLAIRPESLLSVSFQMSFAAVTCLIYFYDITHKMWIDLYSNASLFKKAALYFLGICITTIIASIATAPFALYHFGQVSFVGSIANLVAVPLFCFFIMPFALLSLLTMPFGLEVIPLKVMEYGIKWMLDISYWAASLPHAVIRNSMWPFSAFLLIVTSTLFIIIWKGKGKILAIPFLVFGLFMSQKNIMPDILVSDSHKLFMFRITSTDNKTILLTSSRRNDRFILKNWEKLYGLQEKSARLLGYKGSEKSNNFPIYQCGEQGCRFIIKGKKVSFARSAYILKEECAWADLLISVEPIPDDLQCQSHHKIDKFDTWRKGVHAIWITNNNSLLPPDIKVKTVAHRQGNRPWNIAMGKTR